MRRTSLVIGSMIVLTGIAHSQPSTYESTHGRCEVWGQIVAPGGLPEDGAKIELTGKSTRPQQAHLVNGNFDFHAVPAGWYQFKVFDRLGRLILKRSKLLTGKSEQVLLVYPL